MNPYNMQRFLQPKHIYPEFNIMVATKISDNILPNLPQDLAIVISAFLREIDNDTFNYDIFLENLHLVIFNRLKEILYFDDDSVAETMTISIIQSMGYEYSMVLFQYVTALIQTNI